jgi:hypothetical protein
VRVVTPGGRAVVIKQPTPASLAAGRTLDQELYIYRLAGWIQALADILPAPVLIDERRHLLVCECLSTGPQWPDETELATFLDPDLTCLLGRAAATWHQATAEIPLPPSPAPQLMQIALVLDEALAGRSVSAQAYLRFVAADREFAELFREAAAAYRPTCLIHGDIRPDNWARCRRSGNPALKVFDWEMGGFGDPAWDLAGGCAEAIVHVIRMDAPVTVRGSLWPPAAVRSLHTFLSAYSAAGIDVVNTADPDTWQRVALFTSVRLLHIAGEWAEFSELGAGSGIDLLVAQARRLLHTYRQAAALLADWAHT